MRRQGDDIQSAEEKKRLSTKSLKSSKTALQKIKMEKKGGEIKVFPNKQKLKKIPY